MRYFERREPVTARPEMVSAPGYDRSSKVLETQGYLSNEQQLLNLQPLDWVIISNHQIFSVIDSYYFEFVSIFEYLRNRFDSGSYR